MNSVSFGWSEPTSLAAELSKPIKQVFVEFQHPAWGPTFVTLWRFNGPGLRIASNMHDVAERLEIGVLSFSYAHAAPVGPTANDVAPEFGHEITVSKLIIQESGTSAESGVVFTARNNEIVIVAGAFPYTLAVNGVLSASRIFEPEYPMNRYIRVPLK